MEVAAADSGWAVGFEDECWWSRLALPASNSWTEEGKPLRLLQQPVAKEDDPDPKAVSCYGLYLPELDQTWVRFVDGRPVSGTTRPGFSDGAPRSSKLSARRSWFSSGTTRAGIFPKRSGAGLVSTTARSKRAAKG
jgi:hypothetical protein